MARHTFATMMLTKGVPVESVSKMLGHTSITTTQLYAAHKTNVKRDLVKNMEWEIERNEK